MATLKRLTSYMCGECGEKIMVIRHNCPKCKVAFDNVENFTYGQQLQSKTPPLDCEGIQLNSKRGKISGVR